MHINPTLQKVLPSLRRAGFAADLPACLRAGNSLGGVRVDLGRAWPRATALAEALADDGIPVRVCTTTRTLVLC